MLLGMPFLEHIRASISVWRKKLITPYAEFNLDTNSVVDPMVGITLAEGIDLPDLTERERKVMTETQISEWEHKQEEVREILLRNKCTWDDEFRGITKCGEHHIVLNQRRPVVNRRRHFTEQENKIIYEEVNKMLKQGVIRKSESPYVSYPSLQVKPDKSIRFCIDYRAVNRVTVRDEHPLPNIAELIRAVEGSRYFVALDLRHGYWQIPMAEESKKYTAFACHMGLYEFNVLPFGLTNSAATFQRIMNNLFIALRHKGVLVYLDDILIHAKEYEECKATLEEVLTRLGQWQLKLNLKKSVFSLIC